MKIIKYLAIVAAIAGLCSYLVLIGYLTVFFIQETSVMLEAKQIECGPNYESSTELTSLI